MWDVALVCMAKGLKSQGRWTWQNWALAGRWLPGSGRLGVCVWRNPPDQERVTRAMFVRQLDTW